MITLEQEASQLEKLIADLEQHLTSPPSDTPSDRFQLQKMEKSLASNKQAIDDLMIMQSKGDKRRQQSIDSIFSALKDLESRVDKKLNDLPATVEGQLKPRSLRVKSRDSRGNIKDVEFVE